jgi:GLPGLI family protein
MDTKRICKKFIIKDNIYAYDWNITDKKKDINGITCQLAVTQDAFKNTIYAWYTTDIPLSTGPSIYHGLPGLIVKIETKSFEFQLLSFRIYQNDSNLNFNETGNIINQEEFVSLFEAKMKKMGYKF